MTNPTYDFYPLTYPGIINVEGDDAQKFLQGQLTCDMNEVTLTTSRLGAHCNPQGRIISLFRIIAHISGYYLQMPSQLVPVAMNALKKYAVFFKVNLADQSTEPLEDQLTKQLEDIQAKIPALYPETSEKFLAHELNLPELGAVSFTKGCFTGQEIIARMQYRGKLKNHLYLAESLIKPLRNQDVYDNHRQAGYIVDYAQSNSEIYKILVIAREENINDGHLFLDTAQQSPLKLIV